MTACELHTNFDITALAEEMISDLQADWKSPFDAPVLLFSDRKVEQWFRLFWLKAHHGTHAALMNLQSLATEQFLFSMLAEPHVKKLSTEFLCDLLVAKLPAPTADGVPYFKTLGSEAVTAYLTHEQTGAVDEIHLYDFAEQMAALLIDYETTRPAHYDEAHSDGLLATWRADKAFFGNAAHEAWQKKLYRDLLSAPISVGNTQYATLGYVFNERLRQPKDGKVFTCSLKTPVYLFGFSGMGQLHRTILQAFSREHALKVYLQGSLDESAHTTNELFKSWGQFGRENLQWWKSWSKPVAVAAATAETPAAGGEPAARDEARLTRVAQHTFVTEAASKIREVEYVHSTICALLNGTASDSEPGKQRVLQSDILVLAPDISAYRTAILEVFDQHEYERASLFPALPYRILDLSARTSHVCTAVHTLVSILEQGTITRPDFFALVRSPFVQRVRGITQDMADTWLSWVEAMQLYRTHSGKNDWTESVKRLLLARLTDTPVTASDGSVIIPYSDFESGSNDTLGLFVDCITSLQSGIELVRAKAAGSGGADSAGSPATVPLTCETVQALKAFFDSWLLYTDASDTSFTSEQVVYRRVSEEFERQLTLFAAEDFQIKTLSLKGLTLALKAASLAAQGTSSAVFTGGITFASFQPNRILPADYVFIMGLDSKSFPGIDRTNNLDLRTTAAPWLCDNSIAAKNRYSFLCQLMATGKALFLSYVNSDLQKDAPFYASSVIHELERFASTAGAMPEAKHVSLTVDETRPWSELFTSRAFRNKHNYKKLSVSAATKEADTQPAAAGSQDTSAVTAAGSQDAPAAAEMMPAHKAVAHKPAAGPDRVTLSQLVKFLEDPFQFRVNNLFSKESGEDASEERIAFEPIELSPLPRSRIFKAYAVALLEAKKQSPSQPLSAEAAEAVLPPAYQEEALYTAGILPEKKPFGKKAWLDMQEDVRRIALQLDALSINAATLVPQGNAELPLEQAEGTHWTLTGALNPYWENADGITVVSFLRDKTPTNAPGKAYLASYLTALAVTANRLQQNQQQISVRLAVCNSGWTTATSLPKYYKTFPLTPAQAREILQQLYDAAFIQKFCTCVPFDLYAAGKDKAPDSLFALRDELSKSNGGIWSYFAHKNLFDPIRDIGFTPADFNELWEKAVEKQKKLCLFI